MDFDNTDFGALLDNIEIKKSLGIKKKKTKPKPTSKYSDRYDDETEIEYKALRLTRQDPISFETLEDESKAFKFRYMWNPYTGERLGEDPYGPLYFNPINLIRYWYMKRLDNLYIKPVDSMDGYWGGTAGDGVGAGENCTIRGRGQFPDRYLFRLPILNCYIPQNNTSSQAVTMGPKLTSSEIDEIYDLAQRYWQDTYAERFRRKLPDLKYIKENYDLAIKIDPLGSSFSEEQNFAENMKGVNNLIKIR